MFVFEQRQSQKERPLFELKVQIQSRAARLRSYCLVKQRHMAPFTRRYEGRIAATCHSCQERGPRNCQERKRRARQQHLRQDVSVLILNYLLILSNVVCEVPALLS